MPERLSINSANTILYCNKWPEMVDFYQNRLNLPVTFFSDWLVEFQLSESAYLSVANARQTTISSSQGAGLTLTFRVESADKTWQILKHNGIAVGSIKDIWGARVFYFFDPEGYRLEVWSSK
jgi:predicted enzyme related to lactoylglutathione lyase